MGKGSIVTKDPWVHGQGYRPCSSRKRQKSRAASVYCMCAGENSKRAPQCGVIYSGSYCQRSSSPFMKLARTIAQNQVRKSRSRSHSGSVARSRNTGPHAVFTCTVTKQPKSCKDLALRANTWSLDPELRPEGELPFRVATMSSFKPPGKKKTADLCSFTVHELCSCSRQRCAHMHLARRY